MDRQADLPLGRMSRVAIVGVGLIGGSIGLGLRQRGLAREVVGIGRRRSSLRKALAHGAVDRTTTDVARGVRGAELVVVCTPVEAVVTRVCEVLAAADPGTCVTDAASTKMEIVTAVQSNRVGRQKKYGTHFVGSHPLAGDHRTGPEYARADLLVGRTVIVTPTRQTRAEDLALVCRFWAALGARAEAMTPRAHDRAVAAISHVPHLVASALAASTPKVFLPLAAAGWLDTTRVAAADPRLWEQILRSNRHEVLAALTRLEKTTAAVRQALEHDQRPSLHRILAQGKQRRDAMGS